MSDKVVRAIKFPKLKPEHAGKWVVMSSATGRFITAGKTLAEARKNAEGHTERKTVFKVMPNIYAGTHL